VATSYHKPPPCPQTSWLWLVDVPNHDKAIALGPHATVAAELAEPFGHVTSLDTIEVAPLADAAFACIAAASQESLPDLIESDAALAKCRRLLRPEGVLALSYQNWDNDKRKRRRRRAAARALPARLRSAGFSSVTTFFLQPDASTPRHIIPDTPAAMLAHERGRGFTGVARRVLARAGAGSLLYSGVLFIARA
jgi:SAM-dependent methyltransferase